MSEISTVNGEEIHTPSLTRSEASANHQFIGIVHAAIQGVLAEMKAPGCTASVGVSKQDAIAQMDAGVSPEELAFAVRDKAFHQWVLSALNAGRLEHLTAETVLDGEEVAVTTLQGVVFTDQQFGEFLLQLETQILNVCDTAVAIALAGNNEVKERAADAANGAH